MLLVNNITKIYNELDSLTRVVALKNVTLTLPDNGLVAIVGSSGCGKTTLLNILGGIDQPSDGRVFCNGEEVDFSSSINLDVYRSYSTSLVFQEYNLLHDYNVLDNVKLGLQLQGKSKREITDKAKTALDAVGLSALAKRKISTLSGGQQQRVAVARAIAKDSKIVFCDEPTGNLDSLNANEVFTFIKQCSSSRLFVVVTHDEGLARLYADRIIRLSDGVVVADTVDDMALRRALVPDADSLFAVDNRMTDTERIARYIKKKVSQSSEYVKKRAGTTFETIYDDSKFADSFKKSAERAGQDIKRIAKYVKSSAEVSFNVLHIKGSSKMLAQAELEKFGIRVKKKGDSQKHKSQRKAEQDKRVHGLAFANVMMMIKNNIFRSAIFNSIMVLAMVIALSLVTVFFSLQLYKGQDALANTLIDNQSYLLPLVKYKDIPIEKVDGTTGATIVEHGPKLYYAESKESDLYSLQQTAGNGVNVYASYFWSKNLQDFCDFQLYSAKSSFSYVPYNFRELVVVEDFSILSTQLRFGRVPNSKGEVLIFDYMANALISHHIVDSSITQLSRIVGVRLTDVNTGVSFTISGVLKSNYSQYKNADGQNSVDIEEGYLSVLQSVFCSKETSQQLLSDSQYTSVGQCKIIFADSGSSSTIVDTTVKKLKKLDNIDNVALQNPMTKQGIYISLQTAGKLLGKQFVDIGSVSSADAQKLFSATVRISAYGATYLPKSAVPSTVEYPIAGVYAEDITYDNVYCYYVDQSATTNITNGQFRTFYLNLSKDWKLNGGAIDSFWKQDKSDEFYRQNPDYTEEGYAEASSFGIAIRNSDYYLVKVRALARDIMIIILAVVTVLIVIYTGYTLKKYNYKIAVLKALGANTTHILAIFGTQLLLLGLLAFLVSIPVAFIAMSQINAVFVDGAAVGLIFFAIKNGAIWLALVFAVFGVLLAASFPLLRTSMASPMKVIRANKKSR